MAAATGYLGTPLSSKLGIKPGARVCVLGEPTDYQSLLEPLPERVAFTRTMSLDVDLTHIFATGLADLTRELQKARKNIRSDAMGCVDVKVCAVTEVWSGLKLAIRKELRPWQLAPAKSAARPNLPVLPHRTHLRNPA